MKNGVKACVGEKNLYTYISYFYRCKGPYVVRTEWTKCIRITILNWRLKQETGNAYDSFFRHITVLQSI